MADLAGGARKTHRLKENQISNFQTFKFQNLKIRNFKKLGTQTLPTFSEFQILRYENVIF